MKREGISTFFIRSYLRALSCLLDHLKISLFEKCFVMGVSLKIFFKIPLLRLTL